MANAITNPLYGLTVGSVAFGEDARFGASVLESGVTITRFVPGQSGEMSMTGSSEYIYTDHMNQGSFGVSGSYGVSGVAKVSGKLSGYFGNTVANSGKTLSIILNSIDWAGVEYIDFNQLNPQELMTALSPNVRVRLATALAKFNAMQNAHGGTNNPGMLVTGLPPIEMTLRGVLLAGKDTFGGRDEATLKGMPDGDCRNTLITELDKHSNHTTSFQKFDNNALIGKGAVVVLLLHAGIRDLAWLQNNNDDTHRITLIDDLARRTGRTDLQDMSDQKLVQLGIELSVNLKPAVREWVLAVEEFFRHHGTGVVAGVLWGGWGAAKLEFRTKGEEKRWKYGGSGNFSYVGVGGTTSISAAYGGSKSTIGQNASASIDAFWNGACEQARIDAWVTELRGLATKGLSELGDKAVTRDATLGAPLDAPSIPEFAKPQKDPKVTDLFKEIKSLDGLKAYAQAAAWEKNKKAGKTESLQDFLTKASAKNDVSGVPEVITSLFPSSMTPAEMAAWRPDGPRVTLAVRAGPPAETPKSTDKYEPLGVWIVDWARLFPWLVTGHDNAVTSGLKALDWIRLKTLHQDCLSLARLYDRLEGEDCKVLVNNQPVDFSGIRDSFSHVAEGITGFLNSRPDLKDVSNKIRSSISEMSADARNIYAKWNEFSQFRRCQLGAGVIFEHVPPPRIYGVGAGPYTWDPTPNTTVSDLTLQSTAIEIQQEPCAFQEPNYSAFARYGKAWPFIIPNGRILAFVSVGSASTSGILCFRRNPGVDTFSIKKQASCPTQDIDARPIWLQKAPLTDGPWCHEYMALPFTQMEWEDGSRLAYQTWYDSPTLDLNVGVFTKYAHTCVRLYPIPFVAARGISDWKGCAMTTGMGELGKDLKAIKEELSQLNRYTFDSDSWASVNGVDDLIYSMEMVKPTYIGLTEAPPNNIMPSR